MSRKYRITEIRFAPDLLEKWMHQNNADYTGDYEDGVLLDSFVVACKRGYAAIYEHAKSAWASDYYVEFAPYKDDIACKVMWRNWEKFVQTANA